MKQGNNLRKWREQRGWTIAVLAEKLGTTSPTVSRIETAVQQPRAEMLRKITELFGMSAADFYATSNVEPAMLGSRRVPVWDYVQAGKWAGVAPYLRDEEMQSYISTDEELSDVAFALVIRGDSMEPEFKEGDFVVIDPAVKAHPGDFVVAKDSKSGEATFKLYRPRGFNDKGQDYFELVPLNPDYPPMRSDHQQIEIVGTMMEHRKRRRRR